MFIDLCWAENAAVDAQQKGETAGNANGVKEENNITPEGESKDYHEKAAALPTFDTSTDKELQLKNSEDDKTGYFSLLFSWLWN